MPAERLLSRLPYGACLDSPIGCLPDGLEHLLADNGSDLSEWQRQRMAVLACAVLSPAPRSTPDQERWSSRHTWSYAVCAGATMAD